MLQHWFRVDMRLAAFRMSPHWLLSRSPSLTLDQFQGWWCASRVLCCVTVPAGARPHIALLWDVQRPVPLPPVPLVPGYDDVDLDPGLVDPGLEPDMHDRPGFSCIPAEGMHIIKLMHGMSYYHDRLNLSH